jgi:sporulation protein YlmC with PRC-barrel domain
MPAGRPSAGRISIWPLKCSNNVLTLFNRKKPFIIANLEQFIYLYVANFFMTRVFARSLSRKKIMSNDGKLIGTLKNIRVDFDSGQVQQMIIHPDQTFSTDGYTLEDDKLLIIPFEAVKDIKDYIVVDRFLARK